MATKVIRENDSSAGIIAVIAVLALIILGFVLYNQGYFGGSEDFNVNLPNGQSISGSVSE